MRAAAAAAGSRWGMHEIQPAFMLCCGPFDAEQTSFIRLQPRRSIFVVGGRRRQRLRREQAARIHPSRRRPPLAAAVHPSIHFQSAGRHKTAARRLPAAGKKSAADASAFLSFPSRSPSRSPLPSLCCDSSGVVVVAVLVAPPANSGGARKSGQDASARLGMHLFASRRRRCLPAACGNEAQSGRVCCWPPRTRPKAQSASPEVRNPKFAVRGPSSETSRRRSGRGRGRGH